jgi:hypothetical protein
MIFSVISMTGGGGRVSHYVAYVGLELVGSSDPPVSASSVAGTAGMHYHAWLLAEFFETSLGK